MQFKVISDIHLEFCDLKLPPGEDTTLLLSGDITVASYLRPDRTDKDAGIMTDASRRFFFEECAKYKNAYYIMGNHEHYHGVWNDSADILRKFLEGSNVKFLEKESVDLGDNIVLWGGTFWTNMKNDDPIIVHNIRNGMNDFYKVHERHDNGYFKLAPGTLMADHAYALESLETFILANPDKKIIAMTHMSPSPRSRHPRYDVNDPCNWFYYSDLDQFVLDSPQIKVWVHGHTHDSHDYMIGSTRMICNPRGYAQSQDQQENAFFDINKTFEV